MKLNGFSNYALETAFLGEGGSFADSKAPRITIPELLEKHGISHVDFMKVDIEGAEFSLFRTPDWLQLVDALSIEVHSSYGNPLEVLDTLKSSGFSCVTSDQYMRPPHSPDEITIVYALRNITP